MASVTATMVHVSAAKAGEGQHATRSIVGMVASMVEPALQGPESAIALHHTKGFIARLHGIWPRMAVLFQTRRLLTQQWSVLGTALRLASADMSVTQDMQSRVGRT